MTSLIAAGAIAVGMSTGPLYTTTPTPKDAPSAIQTPLAPPAPCVVATVQPPGPATQTVSVYNGCGAIQRVKVLVAFGDDGDCVSYAVGQTQDTQFFRYAPNTAFDGLEAC